MKAHVTFAEELAPVLRRSMACPALPNRGQAITIAERIAPQVRGRLLHAGTPREIIPQLMHEENA
jgi:hypothetical protein